MKRIAAVLSLALLSAFLALPIAAQTAPLPAAPVATTGGLLPPGATSSAPIAVGGFMSYNAQPPNGGRHTTGGGFLLYPAANTASGHPTYARLSVDVQPAPAGCRGCLSTAFRLGMEQVLFSSGQFVTTAGADYGLAVANNTVGSLGFDLREAYRFKDKTKFINGAFVSFGGEQNGNTGLVSKFEVGAFKTFGNN